MNRVSEIPIKALIVQDTFIKGQPVFRGEVHSVDQDTFDVLRDLGRAVNRKGASKELLESLKKQKPELKTFRCDKELTPQEAFVAWEILRNKWIGRFSPSRIR